MAKTTKKQQTTKEHAPQFHPGMEVRDRSLVIDINGVAWWVDPHTCTITKAA